MWGRPNGFNYETVSPRWRVGRNQGSNPAMAETKQAMLMDCDCVAPGREHAVSTFSELRQNTTFFFPFPQLYMRQIKKINCESPARPLFLGRPSITQAFTLIFYKKRGLYQ